MSGRERFVPVGHWLDGARVGRARLGEPSGGVLAFEPEPSLRRWDLQHGQGGLLPRDVTAGRT